MPGVASGFDGRDFRRGQLFVDSWRWAGVPVYIRAGKELPVTCTEALVEFKRPPRETFRRDSSSAAQPICECGSAPTSPSAWVCASKSPVSA